MPSESPNKPSSKPSDMEPFPPVPDTTLRAPGTLLERWSVTPDELTALVDENPSLRGILLGYVAELKLREIFDSHPRISRTVKYDDHDRTRKSDRVIEYRGREFSVEAKSLQTNSIRKEGDRFVAVAQVDGSDRRTIVLPGGKKLTTTLLLRGQFDLLAVNCFAFRNEWRFAFALNSDLPCSTYRKYKPAQRKMLIASLVRVTWPPEPPFVEDPFPLIERLWRERDSGASKS